MSEINTFSGQPVQIRRLYVRVARIPERLRPPLVRQNEYNIRLTWSRLGLCPSGTGSSSKKNDREEEKEALRGFQRGFRATGESGNTALQGYGTVTKVG